MSLYLFLADDESFYVEANSIVLALDAWRKYLQKEDCGTGTEEPESIACVANEPVIR